MDIATCKNQSRASVIICKLTISLVTIDSDNARAYLDHMDAEEEWNIQMSILSPILFFTLILF